jgi:hypothetical protein
VAWRPLTSNGSVINLNGQLYCCVNSLFIHFCFIGRAFEIALAGAPRGTMFQREQRWSVKGGSPKKVSCMSGNSGRTSDTGSVCAVADLPTRRRRDPSQFARLCTFSSSTTPDLHRHYFLVHIVCALSSRLGSGIV